MKDGLEIYSTGTKKWYKNNQLHREDGPAIEMSSGDKYWYVNGKLHRIDGPAIEYDNLYYYKGKYIEAKSDEHFKRLIKLEILW